MSSTTYVPFKPETFERTIADLKQGVATALQAQTAATEAAVKKAKEMAEFHQGTLEALAQATQTFIAGTQDIARQLTEASQAAYTESLASARALAAIKTPKELIELQTGLLRGAADRAVSESTRLARVGLELAEKTTAPVIARATLAAETFAPKI